MTGCPSYQDDANDVSFRFAPVETTGPRRPLPRPRLPGPRTGELAGPRCWHWAEIADSGDLIRWGERPAAGGQPGPDPVDVGTSRLLPAGDGLDGLADGLGRFGVAVTGQLLGDGGDLVVGQLAAEQGEQRDVVDVGHAFGIAGPQPSDDPAQDGWIRHILRPFR